MKTKPESSLNLQMPYHRERSRPFRTCKDAGGRKDIMDLIQKYQMEIIQKAYNVSVTASDVLEILQGLGHLMYLTKANAIGDVLGSKGFNLPRALWNNKRLYLLPAVTWDAAELEAFAALTEIEKIEKVRAIEMGLLGFDSGKLDTPEMKAEKEAVRQKESEEIMAIARSISDEDDDEMEF